jgi:hypothetical protein
MSYSFMSLGTPEEDANGDLVEDASGELAFTVPPVDLVEFTTEVIPGSGGLFTYRYTVENLSSEARTFSIPEVTSPLFPTGWSGTVPALDSESIEFDVTGETVFYQTAQVTLDESDVHGGTYALPCKIYVPESRLSYDGTVAITGITTSGGDNSVSFTITGDDATKAVLWRLDDGVWHSVAYLEQPLAAGLGHTIVEENPPSGDNTYMVQVGKNPNGYCSATSAITNP